MNASTAVCDYTLNVYPSAEYHDDYQTMQPIIYMSVILLVFFFTSIVFVVYDCFVTRRQHKIHSHAVTSNAIVTGLFPAQVRDKLYAAEEEEQHQQKKKATNPSGTAFRNHGQVDPSSNQMFLEGGGNISTSLAGASFVPSSMTSKSALDHYENDIDGMVSNSTSRPIADLFPSATVLFMDIAGFTAWSSQREPCQVFILLETIYHSFDKIAKQRKVFKVETIGDCYVGVCGLPDPNQDHAIVMARFSIDCLRKMSQLVHKLESSLGPDTAELACRVGLHSGPVTAGVLRGERARFQLFGDTVNTCARMESTGRRGRIQISQATAELLEAAGKGHWFIPREEMVEAKGKGLMQTYWLLSRKAPTIKTTSDYGGSGPQNGGSDGDDCLHAAKLMVPAATAAVNTGDDSEADMSLGGTDDMALTVAGENYGNKSVVLKDRIQRLVEYNCDHMSLLMKKMIAKRRSKQQSALQGERIRKLEDSIAKRDACLDEVVEIIELPQFDSAAYVVCNDLEVPNDVKSQLSEYIHMIASMYRDNPFHNFDHAVSFWRTHF